MNAHPQHESSRQQADVLTALRRAMDHLGQDTQPDGNGDIHFCLMRRWGSLSTQPDETGNLTLTDRQAASGTDASIITHLETTTGLHVRSAARHWPAPDAQGHCFAVHATADIPIGFNNRQHQNLLAVSQLLAGPLMELQRQVEQGLDDPEANALAEEIAHADRLVRHAALTMQETMQSEGRRRLGLTEQESSTPDNGA